MNQTNRVLAVTTQTALNTGELAIPRNRYAMLQLQVHVLKLWGLLSIGDDNKTPYGRITLTDVADIDPLGKIAANCHQAQE